MKEGEKRIIFHIDVNNAFLSWTAVKMLKDGEKLDIRKIPSVIGGEEKERHGIVLAKSMPAKKRGVQTAETLYSARQKCPNLKASEFGIKVTLLLPIQSLIWHIPFLIKEVNEFFILNTSKFIYKEPALSFNIYGIPLSFNIEKPLT